MRSFAYAVLGAALVAACDSTTAPPAERQTFAFDFANQTHGWEAGFADYPVGRADEMQLESSHEPLPSEIGQNGSGLYIAGTNHSDDLFMFWKRRVTGLEPNTRYSVSFEVEFATQAPSQCAGIGGAPGESVYVKAGASTEEPVREVEQVGSVDYYRMNIDKSNQSQGGDDAAVIGDVANTNTACTEPQWELKTISQANAVDVTTDATGVAWLIVGTDSGFEGRTELYYTRISAEFNRI